MTAIVEIVHGISGLTPATLYLRALGSSTVANGAGDALAEVDGEPGTYRAAVDEPLTGTHKARMVDGAGNVLYTGVVDMEDDDAVHTVGELADLPIRTRANQDQVASLAVTLSGIVTAIGGVAAAVWSYAVRTLTTPAAGGDEDLGASDFLRYRATRWTLDVAGLGPIDDRTRLYFTARARRELPDERSLLQVEETDGLLIASATEADDPLSASIDVTDEVAGDVTITVLEDVTAALPEGDYYYDLKVIGAGGPLLKTAPTGRLLVRHPVTHAID